MTVAQHGDQFFTHLLGGFTRPPRVYKTSRMRPTRQRVTRRPIDSSDFSLGHHQSNPR